MLVFDLIRGDYYLFNAGISGTTGNSVYYTNTTPTPLTIGGISSGMTFNNRTMQQMWDALLYPELFPTLTNPSSTFVLAQNGLQEINSTLPTLDFTSTFNRGSINPPYGTSGYRSGLPNTYNYTGSGLSNFSSTSLFDTKTITNYVVLEGVQSWTGSVSYDAGEQPKSSKGNNYSYPLPAGQTNTITVSIIGVYPFFGTSSNITTRTKQALALHNAIYWQINMVAESGVYKQTAWFPDAFIPITGIQFYNTISGIWEWIGGSKVNSLTMFTITTTQLNINGNMVNYKVYTHNGALIGARQLRFYTN